jgi:hypothetical protein
LPKARRPGLIPTVRPDLTQTTHWFEDEDTLRIILFLRLKLKVPEGLPMKQDLFSNLKLRRNGSNISIGDGALIPHKGSLNETVKLR